MTIEIDTIRNFMLNKRNEAFQELEKLAPSYQTYQEIGAIQLGDLLRKYASSYITDTDTALDAVADLLSFAGIPGDEEIWAELDCISGEIYEAYYKFFPTKK